MNPASFYRSDQAAPLQQGDVVLAPVGRLTEPDASTPLRWRGLDQDRHRFPFGNEPELGAVDSLAGYAPAIVVTHDCHLDRELLERYRELRGTGRRKAEALRAAEADNDLDRFLVVAPLVPQTAVRATPDAISRQQVIGLFAVPALPAANLPASAADLTFRATIDRHSIVTRLAVLTDEARTALRYALARADALRTPAIGFELENAVGKRIREVRPVSDNPLLVEIELSDGSLIRLVHQPASVDQQGPSRTAAPAPLPDHQPHD